MHSTTGQCTSTPVLDRGAGANISDALVQQIVPIGSLRRTEMRDLKMPLARASVLHEIVCQFCGSAREAGATRPSISPPLVKSGCVAHNLLISGRRAALQRKKSGSSRAKSIPKLRRQRQCKSLQVQRCRDASSLCPKFKARRGRCNFVEFSHFILWAEIRGAICASRTPLVNRSTEDHGMFQPRSAFCTEWYTEITVCSIPCTLREHSLGCDTDTSVATFARIPSL